MFVLLLAIAIEQDNTIIEREDSLEHRTNKIGSNRNRWKQGISTHIEHNSHASRNEYYYGFEPGLGHEEKDQHDEYGRDDHDGHRRRGSILACFHHTVTSEAITDLLAEGFLIHFLRHGEIKNSMCAIGAIAVRHFIHIGIRGEQCAHALYLCGTDGIEHDMHISAHHLGGCTELIGDDIQAIFHLRVIRQILGHIRIHVDARHEDAAYHREGDSAGKEDIVKLSFHMMLCAMRNVGCIM